MSSGVTTATPGVLRRAGTRETTVLLALAWAVPFLLHLIPWSGARPLGVYLLPMFWTTFVAVYLYGGVTGLAVGLFAPAINLIVTGLPASRNLGESMLELIVFAGATAWAVRRWPRFMLIAPLGYAVARVARALWLGVTDPAAPLLDFGAVSRTLLNGLPGLLVLAAINVALAWWQARPAAEKPAA